MPDYQSTIDSTKPRRATWPVPVGLAVAIALYNLVLSPMRAAGPASDWPALLGIGVIFVQPLLLAAWAALGPGALVYRLPVSAATLIAWIFAQSFAGLNLFAPDGARNHLNLEMTVAFVTAFAVASAVIGLVRRATGIHISRCEQPSPPSQQQGRHQFGMKYLLGWMTICALLIVIGRSFVSDTLWFDQRWLSLVWELSIGIVFLLLLMMPPAVLPLLALTRPTPWRWLLLIGAAWPVSLWAAVEVTNMSSRGGPPQNVYWPFGVLQIGATATALGSALVLRLAGFHLTSVVDATPNPRPADPAQ